jgi:hypothetical protein
MATGTPPELKPQAAPTQDDDLEEIYEEEPRRRAWGAIASVVLALALVFVGYQWNQAAGRADGLAAQVGTLRAEAETQRLRAEDAQRQVDGLQKRLVVLAAEKETLGERLAALEKAGSPKTAVARDKSRPTAPATTAAAPPRARATPVAAKKTR